MRLRRIAAVGAVLAIAAYAAAQFGSTTDSRNRPTAPPQASFEQVFHPPAEVMSVLRRSCFDCHSHETRWPWYSHLPGIGDQLEKHVRQGRLNMNLSSWDSKEDADKQADLVAGLCETVKMGAMPLKPYVLLHPQARVSKAEEKVLCDWSARAEEQLLR